MFAGHCGDREAMRAAYVAIEAEVECVGLAYPMSCGVPAMSYFTCTCTPPLLMWQAVLWSMCDCAALSC